jgi:hypothetical protein
MQRSFGPVTNGVADQRIKSCHARVDDLGTRALAAETGTCWN